jgi:hypothetical protein
LCKNLAELLRADLWLDEAYDSGIPGSPGARFVLNLRTPIIEDDDSEVENVIDKKGFVVDEENGGSVGKTASTAVLSTTVDPTSNIDASVDKTPVVQSAVEREIPEGVSVLFVDDDFTLRKLFVRAVKRVTKDWEIDEASNGETAVS